MSHRYKQSKPLGKGKKNMKSGNDESSRPQLMAQESAEIYDFLYVDRARVSALYAQFFPEGILTSVKTTKQSSFSDDQNIGSDVKIFKAEAKSTESGAEGIEHMFDATWSIPFEVLAGPGLWEILCMLNACPEDGLEPNTADYCLGRIFRSSKGWRPI